MLGFDKSLDIEKTDYILKAYFVKKYSRKAYFVRF